MSSFVSELRRRNVLRVAATYALIAWIIIEAGSVLMPTFGAPQWAFQLYVIAVFTGFIVAVALAWIFELTPDGIRLDKDLEPAQRSSRESRQKMNIVIIGLLIVALAVSVTLNVTGIRDAGVDGQLPGERRAIAILPFESLSSNPDNELFADGIHDDLLTKLANLGSFKVIARSSVMEYRDSNKGVSDIAEDLGVDTVLQGTVQRVGDSVRINMQLIDVATDDHLWAHSYDRELTARSIFQIQSEISRSISNALRNALSEAETDRLETMPTADLRAYSLYTEGKHNLDLRRLETLLEARRQFEQAIEIDPAYAQAYAGLAQSILLLLINHQEYPFTEAIQATQDAIDEALGLDPDLADAYAVQGLLKQHVWAQKRIGNEDLEAEDAFETAIALNPNHAAAYMWYASLRDSQQRLDEAIALYERSQELDPLGRVPWSNLPGLYAQRGLNQEALDAWAAAIEIHPEWPTPYAYIAVHLSGLGRLDEALAWYQKARSLSSDPFLGGNIGVGIWYEFGDLGRARELLAPLPPQHPFAPITDAISVLLDGDTEVAQRHLDAVIDSSLQLPSFVYNVASDVALINGDFDKARRYALLEDPILDSDAELVIDRYTVDNVIKLAFIYGQTGKPALARELAEDSLPVIQRLPRLGVAGHGMLDVEAYAILGRDEDALAAFAQAVDEGLRTNFMTSAWPIELNPYLQSIKDDPRFISLQERLDGYMQEMRRNVLDAEANDSLDELRRLASPHVDMQI